MPRFVASGIEKPEENNLINNPVEPESNQQTKEQSIPEEQSPRDLGQYLSKYIVEPVKNKVGKQLAETGEKLAGIPGQFVEHAKGISGDVQSLGRAAGAIPARLAEGALSVHGNLADLALGAGHDYISKSIPEYSEVQEKAPILKAVAPTSEQSRAFVKKLTGEKLEPNSQAEKNFDEVFDAIGSVFNPMALLTGSPYVAKALTGTLLGKAAKFGAKSAGASEDVATGTDIVVNLLSGLPNGKKIIESLENPSWAKVRSSIKLNETHSAKNIVEKIKDIEGIISEGVASESEEKLLKFMGKLSDKIYGKSGDMRINARDLPATKKSLNKLIYSKDLDKEGKALALKLKKTLTEENKAYGKINKEFGKAHKVAEDVTTAIKKKSAINKFLQKNVSLQGEIKDNGLKLLLGGASVFGSGFKDGGFNLAQGFMRTAAGVTAGVVVRDLISAAEAILHTNTGKKVYGQLATSVYAGKVSDVRKNLKALNHIAESKKSRFVAAQD